MRLNIILREIAELKKLKVFGEMKKKDIRPLIDANKLANVRRDILKNKRLSENQLNVIEQEIQLSSEMINAQALEPTSRNTDIVEIHDIEETDEYSANVHLEENTEGTANDQPKTNQELTPEDIEVVTEIAEKVISKLEVVKFKLEERQQLVKIKSDKKNLQILHKVNDAVRTILQRYPESLNLTQVNEILYSAASVAQNMAGIKIKNTKESRKKHNKLIWKEKIQSVNNQKRKGLPVLTEIRSGKNVNIMKKKKLWRIYSIKGNDGIDNVKERLKQEIQAKAQRIKRCEKRSKFFHQNLIFRENRKTFYRELGKKEIQIADHAEKCEIENVWKNIMEKDKKHNENGPWIKEIEDANKIIKVQEWNEITPEEVQQAITKTNRWKSPGMDKVPNFWIKMIDCLHLDLTDSLNKLIWSPENSPEWIAQGTTYLLPKSENTKEPRNYRPITCLATMYKLLTSIISERTYNILED